MQRKYIFQNGRPVLNPEYKPESGNDAPPSYSESNAPPPYSVAVAAPLTIVSTMQDQIDISEVTKLDVPKQFQDTIATMQSEAYIKGFGADNKNVDGGKLIDGLTDLFRRYEIPIGLMSKLTALQGATLHFKIDNSGSMADPSNLLVRDISPYMKNVVNPLNRQFVSRWEEAQDRLHILIDLLAYVPTGPIILSFFDRDLPGQRIILERNGKSPEAFLAEAHQSIYALFKTLPSGGTPIFNNLNNMLIEANKNRGSSDTRTMHYILSDGEPNGGADEIRQIKNLLQSPNRFAASNPVTFLGCSNDRRDYAWMHEMEEIAPLVAALPDFRDEQLEVRKDQGSTFPYSKGMWLLCNVAAAINPNDLDAMDQHMPFTKPTLENLLGRGIMDSEYLQYFNSHPNAQRAFGPDYALFLQAQFALDIPSVQLFQKVLADLLSRDMDNNEDDSDDRDEMIAEQAVINSRLRRSYQGTMYANNANLRAPVADQKPNAQQPSNEPSGCCTIL